MFIPCVEQIRVKVCSIWPYDCPHFIVNHHLSEKIRIAKRFIKFTIQNGFQIDFLCRAIIEMYAQIIIVEYIHPNDLYKFMFHRALLYWVMTVKDGSPRPDLSALAMTLSVLFQKPELRSWGSALPGHPFTPPSA